MAEPGALRRWKLLRQILLTANLKVTDRQAGEVKAMPLTAKEIAQKQRREKEREEFRKREAARKQRSAELKQKDADRRRRKEAEGLAVRKREAEAKARREKERKERERKELVEKLGRMERQKRDREEADRRQRGVETQNARKKTVTTWSLWGKKMQYPSERGSNPIPFWRRLTGNW